MKGLKKECLYESLAIEFEQSFDLSRAEDSGDQ
jgi:hypothetical protein